MKKQSSKKVLLVSIDRVRTLTTEELKNANGGRCLDSNAGGTDRCVGTDSHIG